MTGHNIFPFFRGQFATAGFNEDYILNCKQGGSDKNSYTTKGSGASIIVFKNLKYKITFSKQCQMTLKLKIW